ncbi:TIGR02391 family protein [Actinomyces ruminicola]|uniref:TIGR02391 family protein n=1 Tax=Actinomyces ruminicola TaxID=332524 RepID=A0A1H0A7L5_9ACTO|nr:TIGR02391 family protein [Actinomyces ruminicola]SDN29475.1 TIGR02391 family protein [Actinomyces ruminicola]
MADNPLTLRFDPQTVDHLGSRMYSHLPNAIAELVANAYDADATHVEVRTGVDASVSVTDDGHGMSREDVAEKYLHIGRNRRRTETADFTESGKRRVSGKKGLGKLALFGIGKVVTLETTRAGTSQGTRVTMSYDDLMDTEGEYHPAEESYTTDPDSHGTTVTLTSLRRKTKIDPRSLASSLSRLFNYADRDFQLLIVPPDGPSIEVDNELRLSTVETQFEWTFPKDFTDADKFLASHGVTGTIISANKPLRTTMRGVTLYADGRMVNEPEFFGSPESSHAYSYLTGHLDIDFVDALDEDVIATDRRALVWDHDTTEQLRSSLTALLKRIGREWSGRRRELRANERNTMLGRPVEAWVSSIRSPKDREALRKVIARVTSEDLDISPSTESRILKDLEVLAPPYAEMVWRRLHHEIQDAARVFYERGDYFHAVDEAVKRYVGATATKSEIPRDDPYRMLSKSFGKDGSISVFSRHMRSGGFTEQTADNVDRGQQNLSLGVLSAFRNTIDHEEQVELLRTGALTYEDCLDALSILSYLMRRLDGAERRPATKD